MAAAYPRSARDQIAELKGNRWFANVDPSLVVLELDRRSADRMRSVRRPRPCRRFGVLRTAKITGCGTILPKMRNFKTRERERASECVLRTAKSLVAERYYQKRATSKIARRGCIQSTSCTGTQPVPARASKPTNGARDAVSGSGGDGSGGDTQHWLVRENSGQSG